MKQLRRNIAILLVIMFASLSATAVYLLWSVHQYGEQWTSSASNPRLRRQQITEGRLLDRKGIVLAYTQDGERIYTEEGKTASHVVGDTLGYCSTGAESLFSALLYNLQEPENERVSRLLAGEDKIGRDIVLTVDSRLEAVADDAMGDYRGAVVVMDYTTGEVLCMVSHPQYDAISVEELVQETDDQSAPLLNRALSGKYAPGSTFKIITATAALEAGLDPEETVNCTGTFAVGGGTISCNGGNGHGIVNMEQAFALSCNTYFANLGLTIGADRLTQTAQALGMNQTILWEGISVAGGSLDLSGASDPDIARAAIGQYTDTVTPLYMVRLVSAVANGGLEVQPYLLAGSGLEGNITTTAEDTAPERIMTEETAAQLEKMMLACVAEGTGTKAALSGVDVAGKTGSAQVVSDGSQQAHGWFVGYIADDEHPLAIVVLLENSGSGGGYAAPAAAKILQQALTLGY